MEEAPEDGVRKLSLSPTRSRAPEQSTPPPPPCVPRWLILDRIVHRSTRRRRGVVREDATASALAYDCFDRAVRASLRIADPPAVSRLYLHLPGRPPIEREFPEPVTVAAHRDSILFRLTVPFVDPNWWHDTVSFPNDYFVYSCGSSSPPSLTLLPTCFEGGTVCPELDKLYEPYRRQQQRHMAEEEIGILSYGGDGGEFTVAQLNFSGPDEFDLCVLNGAPVLNLVPGTSMEWRVQKVPKPPNMKTSAYSWRTDAMVPLGRCLCWVDTYQGLLMIDVRADSKSTSDVIYFLLDDKDSGQFWMIEVNMRNKQLQSSAVYIREEEEEGYPPKRDSRSYFFGHHFIPSKFSSYLAEDAITSQKLSEKMQKAKEERVLQKSVTGYTTEGVI